MRITEKILLRKIKAGDLVAFENLFRSLYTPLCHYANKYVKDLDQAEEVVQELFYKVWEKKESLEIKQSLKSYLYRAVYNNCLLYLEHNEVKLRYEKHVKKQAYSHESEVTDHLQVQEIEEAIERTMDSLPEKTRKIFYMSRYEGYKYREIAEQLSISVKTVEANMGKALRIFRESLKEYRETV